MHRNTAFLGFFLFLTASVPHPVKLGNTMSYKMTSTQQLIEEKDAARRVRVRILTPQRRGIANLVAIHQANAFEKADTQKYLSVVDQQDIREEDKELLNNTLQWLPSLCRTNLKHLVLRYDEDAPRGQATSNTVMLRATLSDAEKIAILTHECGGHVIDLGGYTGSPESGTSSFPDGPKPTYNDDPSLDYYRISWQNPTKRKQDAGREDFASLYAMKDPWEDLAEAVVLYSLHNDTFIERAQKSESLQKKYDWIQTYIFGPDFVLPNSNEWDGEIPWDTTKLAHNLSF